VPKTALKFFTILVLLGIASFCFHELISTDAMDHAATPASCETACGITLDATHAGAVALLTALFVSFLVWRFAFAVTSLVFCGASIFENHFKDRHRYLMKVAVMRR